MYHHLRPHRKGQFPMSSDCTSKRCSRCKEFYPATKENFFSNKARKDGLGDYCKACQVGAVKKWRQNHPEQWDEIRKKYALGYKARRRYLNREWNKNNRDRLRARWQRRRAKKRGAGGVCTDADIQKMRDLQKGKCWWCGKKLPKRYHIDHRVPLSRGGTNWPSNLVLSCAFCNLSKGDRKPDEWSDRLL